MPAELKAWLKVFSANLTNHMHLVNIDARLSNMEHGDSTKEDVNAAAATKAKMECNATTKDLEEETKQVMEVIGRAFRKDKMEGSKSSASPKITPPDPEMPMLPWPPPVSHPTVVPGSFPVLQARYHKLSFLRSDGKEDPLPWFNCCEQFFKGQCTPDNEKVWFASFHLTGGVQQWYMRLA
jgi:hypothetical protein